MRFARFQFVENVIDAYYIRQITALKEWLAQNGRADEVICIDTPRQRRQVRAGDPSFIFCRPGGLAGALEKNGRTSLGSWRRIFTAREYEIWEDGRGRKEASLPLYFGLSDEEKNFALTYARRTIAQFLTTGERTARPAPTTPKRFFEKASVDVAFWVRGAVRGSAVVEDMPLIGAIHEAAIRSCRNTLFKPLAKSELESARIEIALLSDLRMPLLFREIRANIIAPEKGYLVSVRGRRGWHLPAVLNCNSFTNLDDFLVHLLEQKAGVSRTFRTTSRFVVFEVENFIEGKQPSRSALTLAGPVVRQDVRDRESLSVLGEVAMRAADFLCRMQEADGNISPIINPLTGKKAQIDLPRLAFTGWSLAAWGKAVAAVRHVEAARRVLTYLTTTLHAHPYLGNNVRCITLVYAYKLARTLEEVSEIDRIHAAILDLLPRLSYTPILYCQVAQHLLERDREDDTLLAKAEEFAHEAWKDYDRRVKSGGTVGLARFPELIPILRAIGKRRADQGLIAKSEALSAWYVSQQLADGSFAALGIPGLTYVRGTGKIFEVLCLEPEKNRASLEKTISWLRNMQYDDQNTYFVPEEIRGAIIGGFRHDAVNQEAWIDAAAHVLLGAARLMAADASFVIHHEDVSHLRIQ